MQVKVDLTDHKFTFWFRSLIIYQRTPTSNIQHLEPYLCELFFNQKKYRKIYHLPVLISINKHITTIMKVNRKILPITAKVTLKNIY